MNLRIAVRVCFADGHQLNNIASNDVIQRESSPALPTPQMQLQPIQPPQPQPGLRHHSHVNFSALPFHTTTGRNITLSSERTVAVRKVDEYCNGYVFTQVPLQCGEKIVVQILTVDATFHGGIAFGLTVCDPSSICSDQLPDDSDMLLERPEYWVVNKDVCTNPEVGDELSFFLTDEGEREI